MSEPSTTERDRIEKLADSFMTSYRAGQHPSIDAYVEQYPELADQLRGLIAALIVLERNAPRRNRFDAPRFECPPSGSAPREIGEFTIVREIGRGGMGVVYEAVQQSLGRHVALKVLSSPGLLNPVHLERFRLEARSAGRLHHSHIVPVFGVGESDGLHYYAMQFIPGQSLDQVIDALRKVRPGHDDKSAALVRDELTESIVGGLLSGRFPADSPADRDGAGAVESPTKPADETRPAAGETSATRKPTVTGQFSSGSSGRPFYESVARVGLQVAEALAYAHGEGILHRDIKPSNLVLDAKGNTWVTDFGLVKAEDSQSLTETGDVVGTLRYMAPERLEGWSDRRSDIYGLGATLYELLTLRPFFESANRAELIDDIRHAAPLAPTKIDPAVPRDLETIVLKALAKEPGSRYHTAEEMAGDLRRFLADRPILARRSSFSERFVRWCRRNPAVATLAATVAFALLAGTTVSTLLIIRATRAESDISVRQAVLVQRTDSALDEVDAQYRRENWAEALAAVKRAEQFLAEGEPSPALAARAGKWRTDLEVAARLEEIRLSDTTTERGSWRERPAAHSNYQREFRSLGIDLDSMTIEEAADRIRARPIRDQLIGALDGWTTLRLLLVSDNSETARDKPKDWWQRPLAVACAADTDEYRKRVRLAVQHKDTNALMEMAQSPDAVRLPASTLELLVTHVGPNEFSHTALETDLLKRAQQSRPDDFYINYTLAIRRSDDTTRPRLASVDGKIARGRRFDNDLLLGSEVISYARVAVALRPNNAWARGALAVALYRAGRLDDAIAAYHEAIRVKPDYYASYTNLGFALFEKRDYDNAIVAERKASELQPESAVPHIHIGLILEAQGKFDEAIAAYRKATDLEPDRYETHDFLGTMLSDRGRLDEGIAEIREAIKLDPNEPFGYYNLGMSLGRQGKLDETIAALRKAIELNPNYPEAYNSLGAVLCNQGKLDEAAGAYHKAIELNPGYAFAYCNLGDILRQLRRTDDAIAACHKAIELAPNGDLAATAYCILGSALSDQRKLDEAIGAYHKSIDRNSRYVQAYYSLGVALSAQGKLDEAIAANRKVIEFQPKFAGGYNGLAWLLATAPKRQEGDTARAVELATKAVTLAPEAGGFWNTLGVARYRSGQWQGAIDALAKSMELQDGGGAGDWFFLAMAHWQLGHKEDARTWYDKSVEWIEKNQPMNDELIRFRAETEHVLGVTQPSATEKDAPQADAAAKPIVK